MRRRYFQSATVIQLGGHSEWYLDGVFVGLWATPKQKESLNRMSDDEYVDVDIRIPEETSKDLSAIAHLMKVPVERLIQSVLSNHLNEMICARTFEQFCEPRTPVLGAPVEVVSPTMTQWANEYGQSIRHIYAERVDQLEAEIESMEKELGSAQMENVHYKGLLFSQEGKSNDS